MSNLTRERALKIAYDRGLLSPEHTKAYEIAIDRGIIGKKEQPIPEQPHKIIFKETLTNYGIPILVIFLIVALMKLLKLRSGGYRIAAALSVIFNLIIIFIFYAANNKVAWIAGLVFTIAIFGLTWTTRWIIDGFRNNNKEVKKDG